jgi:hypothetical protein
MSGTTIPITENAFSPGQVWDATLLTEATAVSRPGAAIQITASVSGTVTLTLASGNTIIVTPAIGDNIYPYQVTKATVGTATITRYYNLYI